MDDHRNYVNQNRRHACRALMCLLSVVLAGCSLAPSNNGLPGKHKVDLGELVFHADFEVPRDHPLVEDLSLRRREMSNLLGLDSPERPIDVYLFRDAEKFRQYVMQRHPDFPGRRALFVKQDDRLQVFAIWGPRLSEDLRHEMTHGFLHGSVDGLGLWLDEGLAEFFEVRRGFRGLNAGHVFLLANELEKGRWHPDLKRLEALEDPAGMTRLDYAEAWLWTHFLLVNPEANSRPIIQTHLQQLRKQGSSYEISAAIEQEFPQAESMLLNHLEQMRSLRELDRQPTWD